MADDTTPNITYELEGNRYDVLKLSQEAQSSYYVILEVEQEIRTLKKRIAVITRKRLRNGILVYTFLKFQKFLKS